MQKEIPLFLCSLLVFTTMQVESYCTDFNPITLQSTSLSLCKMSTVPSYSLADCGRLCVRINKCVYYTEDNSGCYVCTTNTPAIQNIDNVTLTGIAIPTEWDTDKTVYKKASTANECSPSCVKGHCMLGTDDLWQCHCYDSYTGATCNTAPVVAGQSYNYRKYTTSYNKVTAQSKCVAQYSGTLVNIQTTQILADIIALNLGCNDHWTAAKYDTASSSWKWSDGTVVLSQLWANTYPSGAGNTCAVIEKQTERLMDKPCSNSFCYICEKP